jgi:2-dehydro-3-deoxygluconokinase
VFDIKPDKTDVTAGKIESAEFETVCRKLKEKFPGANKIIITLRGSISADHNTWSGILYNGERFFKAPIYQITHIVDRVGGGDSFMGGLIFGLLNYKGDDQKALNFAVAASCLKHTIHGDFNLVSVAEVEQLMKGDSSGRVIR